MTYANSSYQKSQKQAPAWIPRPLNKKGDLGAWLQRMEAACPSPSVGEVVWLNGLRSTTAYKALGFKPNGDVIWQRGEVVKKVDA